MQVSFNISLKEMISQEDVNYKNVSQEGSKTSTDPSSGRVGDSHQSTILQALAQRDIFSYILRIFLNFCQCKLIIQTIYMQQKRRKYSCLREHTGLKVSHWFFNCSQFSSKAKYLNQTYININLYVNYIYKLYIYSLIYVCALPLSY